MIDIAQLLHGQLTDASLDTSSGPLSCSAAATWLTRFSTASLGMGRLGSFAHARQQLVAFEIFTPAVAFDDLQGMYGYTLISREALLTVQTLAPGVGCRWGPRVSTTRESPWPQ